MSKLEKCCPSPDFSVETLPSSEEFFDGMAKLCKGLAHPARVQIVALLLKKKSCVCGEIVDELPLAQSTVSQHLKQLKSAGLVIGEVDGPKTCYCVNPAMLALLTEMLGKLQEL